MTTTTTTLEAIVHPGKKTARDFEKSPVISFLRYDTTFPKTRGDGGGEAKSFAAGVTGD